MQNKSCRDVEPSGGISHGEISHEGVNYGGISHGEMLNLLEGGRNELRKLVIDTHTHF